MAIWSVALVTQVLSIFGLFTEINMMTWMYGVMLGGLFVTLSYQFLQRLAIETARSSWSSSVAQDLYSDLSNEWLMVTAGQALSASILAANKDSWMYAQKMGMGEEKAAGAEAA